MQTPVGGAASGTTRTGHLMAVGFQMIIMLVNRKLALEQVHIVTEHKVCDSKMSLVPWICTGTLRLEAHYSALIVVTAAVKPH